MMCHIIVGVRKLDAADFTTRTLSTESLHSAKGGAVETGCSDSYVVIHYLTI